MKTSLPQIENQLPVVCRHLRTKTAFGTFADNDVPAWQFGESNTAVFWCLKTMATAGPLVRNARSES